MPFSLSSSSDRTTSQSTKPASRQVAGYPPLAGERDVVSLRGSHVDDTFWNRATFGADHDLLPWLRDHGSLTLRIKQRCGHFSVRNIKEALARIAADESSLLGVAPHQLAWSREVLLCADHLPVVFAHSACEARHLRGAWQALRKLGDKPLGALLFSHPQIIRQPLHFKALHHRHPLYRRAASVLNNPPERLWARRSLFYLNNAPLLVTEVFLPNILKLQLRIHN